LKRQSVPAARRSFRAFGRRVSWLLLAKVMALFVVLVYAATISITTNSQQAEVGSLLNVANGLVAIDKGFSVAASGSSANGATCPTSPISFASAPGNANTTIVAGHFVYSVQINDTTASFPTTFNVTLVLGSTTYGPLCIRTVATGANQIIVCKFDIQATTLPASPYTFKVTVQ
jgi:hypothetical protein